jgi:exopolyphosphatase/guanosine-5'-triphosphate,3'-diphosphate pyrophosphatase
VFAAPRPLPDVLAAIDIGTNSVHMVVSRVTGSGRFEVVTREKEMVRLGSGGDQRTLAPDAVERGVAALARCRRIAETAGAEIRAVATAAVRDADNRHEFLERARIEAGIEVEVVSGYEEGRLIHLGVLQALAVYDRRIVLCDIGGGSTELLVGEGEQVDVARSLGLGAISLTARCFDDGRWTAAGVDDCRRFVRDVLANATRKIAKLRPEVLVGTSGTVETLVGMSLLEDAPALPRTLNGAVLTRAELARSIERLVDAGSPDAARALRGIDAKRADILLAGALILDEVMAAVGLDELTFSEGALREGILFDELQRRTGGRPHQQLSDIRRQGVLHLVELCEEDPDHAVQSAWIAGRLFDGLAPTLGLPPEAAELLDAAALLANVGLFISHSRHHLHSYYVIRNAECLTGFTDDEIEVIAQVARYHRRGLTSVDRHAPFAALDPEDRELVRRLAALLRVAIGLDRAHADAVGHIEVDVGDEVVHIGVGGRDPEVDVAVEVWSAGQRTALLADALGRSVLVEAVEGTPPTDRRPAGASGPGTA